MYLCYFEHVWHSEVYFLQQVVALCVFLSIFALLNFVFNFFSFFIVKLMVRVEKKKERKDLTKRNLGPYFSYLIEQMKKKVNDK